MRTEKTEYGSGDLLAVRALHADGQRLSVQFSITPLYDQTDALVGMAAIMCDVTQEFAER